MKKTFKMIAMLAMTVSLFVCAFLLAACDSVSNVFVGRNDMPRLTYVEGQDLDFSAGKLTVQYGSGKSETVVLNSSEVTVSGYDKNTVGRQTVTLSYNDCTTTLDVMVLARVAAESVQTVYYVGEQSLDTAKGKIRIANDDGSTFTVALSDDAISLSGFDSSKAVDAQTITVRYQKDGANYTGSFNVRIYGTENAKFTPPLKTSYRSHETLSMKGAQITYSNGDSKYDKMITVTDDMASGADFSLVKEENDVEHPLIQKISVTYGGKVFEFDITVVYSNVTRLNKLIETVQYENGKPVLNDENGALLIACSKLYLDELTFNEKGYMDKDVINGVLGGAAEYAYQKWSDDLERFDHTFTVNKEDVVYRLESYETSKSDMTALADADAPINAYQPFLKKIAETDGLEVNGEAIGDYLAPVLVYGEKKEVLLEIVTEAVSLYEKLKDVPADWSSLAAYKTQIDAVRDTVTAKGKEGRRSVYAHMSSWRGKNDFFDIVYAYYTETEDNASIDALKSVILPHALEEIYGALMSAITQYTYIYNGVQTENGKSHISDSSFLFYYFDKAADYAQAVKEGSDAFSKTLYETLTFDGILYNSSTQESIPVTFDELFYFIKTTSYGYYDLMGGMLDDSDLLAVWDHYLSLLDDFPDEELADRVSAVVSEFASLSAARQQVFLLTMNVYYSQYEKPALDTEVAYTYFIRLLTAYYSEEFNEDEFKMFRNLLLAIEHYSRRNDEEHAIVDFLADMAEIKSIYDSSADTAKFDGAFRSVYEKYAALAEKFHADGTPKETIALDEHWQSVFDALKNEIAGVLQAYNTLTEKDETKQEKTFIRVLASYERAKRLVADILADTTPAEVKEAYAMNLYSFGESLDWTLDYAFTYHGAAIAMFAYTNLSVSGETFWEVVASETALRDFFATAAPVVWLSNADGMTFTDAAKENIVNVMKAFLALDTRYKGLFVQLQGIDDDHDYYYDGLTAFFAAVFKQENAASTQRLCAAAEALMNAEKDYSEYLQLLYEEENGGEVTEPTEPDEGGDSEEVTTSAEALENFKKSAEAYIAAYEALTAEERTAFELLSDIYGYYVSEYDRLCS